MYLELARKTPGRRPTAGPQKDAPVSRRGGEEAGFTVIELLIVIVILAAGLSLVVTQFGSVGAYRQNAFQRDFKNIIQFLYHQAVADRQFYALEIDFEAQTFRAGQVVNDDQEIENTELGLSSIELGAVSTELNAFLNPALGASQLLIEPPGLPSLFRARDLPARTRIEEVRTPRGVFRSEDFPKALVFFSPRGFSEFATIIVRLRSGRYQTLVVNPFTGFVEQHEGIRDFEYSYPGNTPNENSAL